LRFTKVNSVHTTEVEHLQAAWGDIAATVRASHECEPELREQAPLFTGWQLQDVDPVMKVHSNGYSHYSRCRENCVALSFLTLDIDNDPSKGLPYCSYNEALAELDGLECLLYSSYNHLNPAKHGAVDKLRVLLPLAAPLPLLEYQQKWKAAWGLFPYAARESFTPSQPYWPALHHSERAEFVRSTHLEGELLDLRLLPETAELPPSIPAPAPLTTASCAEAQQLIIKSTTAGTDTALGWYHRLQEGYDGRQPCFSFEREEKRATAFMYRDGAFLVHIDMGTRHRTAIRCIEPTSIRAAINIIKRQRAPGVTMSTGTIKEVKKDDNN
jgi:hypothetical protein